MSRPQSAIPLRPDPTAMHDANRRSLLRAIAAKSIAVAKKRYERDVLKSAWPSDARAAALMHMISEKAVSSFLVAPMA